jgi:hypothetical protein
MTDKPAIAATQPPARDNEPAGTPQPPEASAALREAVARAIRECPSVWTRSNDIKPWRWFECCRYGGADEPEIVVLSAHDSEPEMLEALARHIDELRGKAAIAAIVAAGFEIRGRG